MRDSAPLRPDWVMVGATDGVQCILYASNNLTQAELVSEMEDAEFYFDGWRPAYAHPTYTITLTVGLRTYVVATGPTYADCVANLMKTWSPDREPTRQPAVEGRGQIGAGQ